LLGSFFSVRVLKIRSRRCFSPFLSPSRLRRLSIMVTASGLTFIASARTICGCPSRSTHNHADNARPRATAEILVLVRAVAGSNDNDLKTASTTSSAVTSLLRLRLRSPCLCMCSFFHRRDHEIVGIGLGCRTKTHHLTYNSSSVCPFERKRSY
jgi:hypothetical protein